MFSQFRNAVEHLAQQQSPTNRRPASNSVSSAQSRTQVRSADTQHPRTTSLDETRHSHNQAMPSQLAESALLNLRKTFISTRSSSPSPSQMPDTDSNRHTRSLEERLRASFALGDASERTTPDASKLPTPGEVEPASVALPLSPDLEQPISSLEEAFDPLGAQLSPTPSQRIRSPTAIEIEQLSVDDSVTDLVIDHSLPKVSPSSPSAGYSPQMASPRSSPLPDLMKMVKPPGEELNETVSDGTILAEPAPKAIPADLSGLHALSYTSTPRLLSPFPTEDKEHDVEKLRERLKLVEQRFSDVSTSFKRLQAEKRAADQVLKELSPLESITDIDGLRDHFRDVELKAQMSTEEINRLNRRIQQHDRQLEELRDTHRLETASQSEQVEQLRKQVSEAEALLKAGEEASMTSKTELEQFRADLQKARGVAKEEEEKRTKAISLLKTVRAKLVKAEKEKDDAIKEMVETKDRDKEVKEQDQIERARLELDLERARLDKEREMASLRAQFEREISGLKDRFERENATRKGQSELEAITTKAAHSKELASKTNRITALETTLRNLSQEKDSMFDQLQMRQAELESSQSHLDSVEARSTEHQYQLREAEDRIEILTEELIEVQGLLANGQSSGSSADELARILSETEGKYEARISDLKSKMRALEKERHEAEDEWSKNLQERSRELERLRSLVQGKDREYAESIRSKSKMEDRLVELEAENRRLKAQTEAENGILLGLQQDIERLKDAERSMKQECNVTHSQLETHERQIEEAKVRENMLKASNKALREELRKVQSSAALLERQRNPGIGYWSTSPRTNGFTQSAVDLQNATVHSSRDSVDEGSTTSSTRPSSPTSVVSKKNEEEVNLEYLRNVILQFLEHKEMRPNLVRVLSIILHFTPQETRRLIAKV